jgi:hypothetical protein
VAARNQQARQSACASCRGDHLHLHYHSLWRSPGAARASETAAGGAQAGGTESSRERRYRGNKKSTSASHAFFISTSSEHLLAHDGHCERRTRLYQARSSISHTPWYAQRRVIVQPLHHGCRTDRADRRLTRACVPCLARSCSRLVLWACSIGYVQQYPDNAGPPNSPSVMVGEVDSHTSCSPAHP